MAIAVIGHGRSPEGRGWGRKIDECTVVRMWDWATFQTPADYGTKYDYGVLALIPFSIKPFLETEKPEPGIGWLGYDRSRTPVQFSLPRMEVIGQEYRDRAVRLGARPGINLTRGCVAACWAIGKGEDVILVGFDNLKARIALPTDEAFPEPVAATWDKWHPGWRGRLYTPGTSRAGSHDLAIERPLLEALSHEAGVNLQFAEDVWP